MAFFGKAGKMLRSSISQISHETSLSRPSIFQVIRCMSSSKLFIGGLSYSTDDLSLREAFNKYGEIAEARVIVDRDTGRSRGFGFVTYASVEEASAAIQALDQQELHGRRIRVDYANDWSRGYGGGGFRGGNFGGGYNSGGFGGSYGPAGGYNNNNNADGYGGNHGSGGYGSNYASNNSYDGRNLSYGGNGQNFASDAGGSDNLFSTGAGAGAGAGAGSSSASTGYDGFGDKFGSGNSIGEAGADEGFGPDGSLEGNYRDGDDTYDSYADKRS